MRQMRDAWMLRTLLLHLNRVHYEKRQDTIVSIKVLAFNAICRISSNKKFEIMLIRRAKAYSSSCSQTANLQPFRRSSFLECALQSKIAKINKTRYCKSSKSFKVIDVETTKKFVTSACCDRQHAHAYLQPFSRKTGQQRKNNDFHGGTAL